MKAYIVSFFHRKSVMHQQNTLNEEAEIIGKKYVLNNVKTVI